MAMELDLETFLTALYVMVDDVYQSHIRLQMPLCGGPPALMSDSEVLCLVELGRSIRTVGDMVVYGPNVTKL
jgi:hypothetical protein